MNFKIAVGIFLMLFSNIAVAGVESELVNVTIIRPYTTESQNGATGTIYFSVSSTSLCGTESFKLELSRSGSKEAYSAILSALLTGKRVRLEVDACDGWGTSVRSIYLVAE